MADIIDFNQMKNKQNAKKKGKRNPDEYMNNGYFIPVSGVRFDFGSAMLREATERLVANRDEVKGVISNIYDRLTTIFTERTDMAFLNDLFDQGKTRVINIIDGINEPNDLADLFEADLTETGDLSDTINILIATFATTMSLDEFKTFYDKNYFDTPIEVEELYNLLLLESNINADKQNKVVSNLDLGILMTSLETADSSDFTTFVEANLNTEDTGTTEEDKSNKTSKN